jgi:hypothetical protein
MILGVLLSIIFSIQKGICRVGEGAKGVLLLGIAQCPRKFGEEPIKCSSFKTKI